MDPTFFKTDPSFDVDVHIIYILDDKAFALLDRKRLELCLFLGYLSLEPYDQKVFSQLIEVYMAQKHLEEFLSKTDSVLQKVFGKRKLFVQALQKKVTNRAYFLQKPGLVDHTLVLFAAFFKSSKLDPSSEEMGETICSVIQLIYKELKSKNVLI